jgi:hypothetical protein
MGFIEKAKIAGSATVCQLSDNSSSIYCTPLHRFSRSYATGASSRSLQSPFHLRAIGQLIKAFAGSVEEPFARLAPRQAGHNRAIDQQCPSCPGPISRSASAALRRRRRKHARGQALPITGNTGHLIAHGDGEKKGLSGNRLQKQVPRFRQLIINDHQAADRAPTFLNRPVDFFDQVI